MILCTCWLLHFFDSLKRRLCNKIILKDNKTYFSMLDTWIVIICVFHTSIESVIISIVFLYHYVLTEHHCVLFHLVTDIIMLTELHCVCKFSASDIDCKLFDIMNELPTLWALQWNSIKGLLIAILCVSVWCFSVINFMHGKRV